MTRPLNLVPMEYYMPPAWFAAGRRHCQYDYWPTLCEVLGKCELNSPYMRSHSIAGGEWFPDASLNGAVAGAATISWMFLYDDFFDVEYESSALYMQKPDLTKRAAVEAAEWRMTETLRTGEVVEGATAVERLAAFALHYAKLQQAESGASDSILERFRRALIEFCFSSKLSTGRWQGGMTWEDYLRVRLVNIGVEPFIWMGLLAQGYREDQENSFLNERLAQEAVVLYLTAVTLQHDAFSYAKEFNAMPTPFNSMHLKRLDNPQYDVLTLYQVQLDHIHETVNQLDAKMNEIKNASTDPADHKCKQQFCQAMINVVVGNHVSSEAGSRYWMPFTHELSPLLPIDKGTPRASDTPLPAQLPMSEAVLCAYSQASATPLHEAFRAPAWRHQTSSAPLSYRGASPSEAQPRQSFLGEVAVADISSPQDLNGSSG